MITYLFLSRTIMKVANVKLGKRQPVSIGVPCIGTRGEQDKDRCILQRFFSMQKGLARPCNTWKK
jgi:hypothetical protein